MTEDNRQNLDDMTVLQDVPNGKLEAVEHDYSGIVKADVEDIVANEQASTAYGSQHIGSISYSDGVVYVIRNGEYIPVSKGDIVYQNDYVTTLDGEVKLEFLDGSTFSMNENSKMMLDEMIYDPNMQEGSMSFDLLAGSFRFVSGQISKTDPGAMVLNTPTATIGIRGTEGIIDIDSGVIILLQEADGYVGEMWITNGSQSVVLNEANQFVFSTTSGLSGVEIYTGEIPLRDFNLNDDFGVIIHDAIFHNDTIIISVPDVVAPPEYLPDEEDITEDPPVTEPPETPIPDESPVTEPPVTEPPVEPEPEPEPEIVEVSRSVELETVINSVTSNPVVTTTYEDVTTRENDLDNNKENVTITRNYTDVINTETTIVMTTTPVTTITYSDGTTVTEYGESFDSSETNSNIETETRSEIIFEGTEEPLIETTYEIQTTTEVSDPVFYDSYEETNTEEYADEENERDVTETTITTTTTYQTTTTETSTETPVHTITYSDGTVEVEYGQPVSTVSATYQYTTDTETEVEYDYEEWPEETILEGTNQKDTFIINDDFVGTIMGGNAKDTVIIENDDADLDIFFLGGEGKDTLDLTNVENPWGLFDSEGNEITIEGTDKMKLDDNFEGEVRISEGDGYSTITISEVENIIW